jgi:integrase
MEAKPQKILSLQDARCKRVDLARGTLDEAWNIYVASQALEQLKPRSRSEYAHAAKIGIAALPPRPTQADVTLWLEQIVRDGSSPATANKFLRVWKAITERASIFISNGDLKIRNAFRAQRQLRLVVREKRDAKVSTVRRLLELAATPIESLAIRFAALYGLRISEILGLQPCDVRMDYGVLRVRVIRQRASSGVSPRKNASAGKPHVLAIDSDKDTHDLITHLLMSDARAKCVLRAQRHLVDTWLVPWGCSYPHILMRRWRKDELVELGKGDAWHALRHFGATAVAATQSVVETQAWLGDSTASAAMTYQGQVRGTTRGTAKLVLAHLDAEVIHKSQPSTIGFNPILHTPSQDGTKKGN